VRATSAFVRLFIRGLAWDAEAASATFAATLKSAAKARLSDSSKGKVLVGTTAGGTSVTYALPPMDSLTADDLAEVCSLLLDKVDALKAATPSITDAQLVTALLAEFPSVRRYQSDYSGARW
jgi:hypothetical protein